MKSVKMRCHIVCAICFVFILSAYLDAEEPRQSGWSRMKQKFTSRQEPTKQDTPKQSQESAALQSRIDRLEAENERLRKALLAEREKNQKNIEALNALQRVAVIFGIKSAPETTVSRLESDIRIKLNSSCYVPQKRLSPSQLAVIRDLLADEPALFQIIEIYHRFIISLDAGRLIHIPDAPGGNP